VNIYVVRGCWSRGFSHVGWTQFAYSYPDGCQHSLFTDCKDAEWI